MGRRDKYWDFVVLTQQSPVKPPEFAPYLRLGRMQVVGLSDRINITHTPVNMLLKGRK